jgi:hypothetical protein
MVRDAENDAKSEALRAMQAEGQKLADLLRGVWYLTYPGTLAECGNEVDAALSEWGMVVMGFERHEPPGAVRGKPERGEEHADDAKP